MPGSSKTRPNTTHNTQKEMNMSNPYELRFKLLEMAQGLETDRYHMEAQPFWTLYAEVEKVIDELQKSVNAQVVDPELIDDLSDMLAELKTTVPPAPSTESIKQKAAELYEFVVLKPVDGFGTSQ
jgi:hypothetical protein